MSGIEIRAGDTGALDCTQLIATRRLTAWVRTALYMITLPASRAKCPFRSHSRIPTSQAFKPLALWPGMLAHGGL
jgi:hypothetical protein